MDRKVTRREFVRESAAAAAAATALASASAAPPDKRKILNYNPDMEYRPCGRTGTYSSAVSLGGHWKRIDKMIPGIFKGRGWLSADLDDRRFRKNRYDVVTRCIEVGINHIDACTIQEVKAYARALKGRRDKMYLHASWYQREMRKKQYRTKKALLETLDWGLKDAGLDYVDLWRISLLVRSSRHTEAEIEEAIAALDWAKKSGRARFVGFSSHDRPHLRKLVEKYYDHLDVILTPYTARTRVVADENGLWATIREHDIGWFGIKPFASNSVFKGDARPGNPHYEDDNRLARLIIRCILCNEAITAPIPGLITVEQVDNVARAVKERRDLDAKEKAELDRALESAWAALPPDYQWLKEVARGLGPVSPQAGKRVPPGRCLRRTGGKGRDEKGRWRSGSFVRCGCLVGWGSEVPAAGLGAVPRCRGEVCWETIPVAGAGIVRGPRRCQARAGPRP